MLYLDTKKGIKEQISTQTAQMVPENIVLF